MLVNSNKINTGLMGACIQLRHFYFDHILAISCQNLCKNCVKSKVGLFNIYNLWSCENKNIFDPKIVWTKKIFGHRFFGPKSLSDQYFFVLRFLFYSNLAFGQKIFLTQRFFIPNSLWTKKLSWTWNFFLSKIPMDPIFFYPKCFWTWNSSWIHYVFWTLDFLVPIFFL